MLRSLIVLLMLVVAPNLSGAQQRVGDITVSAAWSRATPAAVRNEVLMPVVVVESPAKAKTINKYLAALGKKHGDQKIDNHGFRHNFVTALAAASVNSEIALELRGHEQKGMSAVYIKALPLAVLAEAVAKVDYPGLDLAHLRPGAAKRR